MLVLGTCAKKKYFALLGWCNCMMEIYPDKMLLSGSQNKIATLKVSRHRQVVRIYHHNDIAEKHPIPSRTGQHYSYNEILK